MKNIRIGYRLSIAFVLLILGTGIISYVGVDALFSSQADTSTMVNTRLPLLTAVMNIEQQITLVDGLENGLLIEKIQGAERERRFQVMAAPVNEIKVLLEPNPKLLTSDAARGDW